MPRLEFTAEANGMSFALQRWGEGGLPVLAVHGWLDNSESFAPLAAHLPGIDLVAPDLAGHGRSGHRPASGSYNIWDDLRDLLVIADQLGWRRFSVLGHSRGAMIALLLAASLPGRIASAAFLDGFWPLPEAPEQAPAQLASHLRDFTRPRSPGPVYASIDDAVTARQSFTRLPAAVLRPMVERNLLQGDGGWRWATDSRLRYASAFKLTDAHNRAFANAVQCPGRVLLADKGMAKYRAMLESISALPTISVSVLEGEHHLHMENPTAVAASLQDFWQELPVTD